MPLKILICRVCLFMQGTNYSFIRKQSRTQKLVENFLILISQPCAAAVFWRQTAHEDTVQTRSLVDLSLSPCGLPLPSKDQRRLYNLSPGLKPSGVIGGCVVILKHAFIQDCVVTSCRDKRDVKASLPEALWPRAQQTGSRSFAPRALLALHLSGWLTQVTLWESHPLPFSLLCPHPHSTILPC